MKKIVSILSVVLLIVMVLSLNTNLITFASSGTGTVAVAKNSVMTRAKKGITRTRKYGYVEIRANSVYPVGNYDTDNYTQCGTKIYHNKKSGIPISNKYTLTEGKLCRVYILDGYLDQSKFDLCFAGNTPSLDAYVAYFYDGK